MKGEKKKEKDLGSYAETYEYLNKRAVHTFKNGYYLESAIIIFQNLEIALRLIVIISAMGKGLSILTMKRILENDNRFVRLVDYFSLFRPEMPSDRFPEKLKKFNEKMNSIIHKLFFKKYDSLNKELKDICEEGFRINSRLDEITREIIKNGSIFTKDYFQTKAEELYEISHKGSKNK
jgi:hypothetical protein